MVIRSRKFLVQIRTKVIIKSMANHQICHSKQVTAKITKINEIKGLKTGKEYKRGFAIRNCLLLTP